MGTFFTVKTSEEVLKILDGFSPCGQETVTIDQALGRVLSEDIVSHDELPSFFRSTMDGYAVRARDTFGASESLPALLEVIGEVRMGEVPEVLVGDGQAVRVHTGGMLPGGADGVVMVEYCHELDEKALEVTRTISPLEHVIQPGDDFRRGATALMKGDRLRVQDMGVLAGLGKTRVPVYRRPNVAIVSTGDEVVDIDQELAAGKVRDMNRYTLSAFCRCLGAVPLFMGLCPDVFDELKELTREGLSRGDTLWVTGGSSVGTRDLTLQVLESLPDFRLLAHGVSISPGKPTIIGRCGEKPVIGLPGHVASAIVVAEVFLRPLIYRLSGLAEHRGTYHSSVVAELARNVESTSGREDYVRVRLLREGGRILADPIFGKSGLISTLVQADGLLKIDRNTEGLYQGQMVEVMLFDHLSGGVW